MADFPIKPMNRPRANRFTSRRSGFALVATLALMILLAVLALGMLSLSSISLRASAQGKALAEARANARLGMLLAIGRLQELAGDDRRVTATADLGMDPASTHGSRHWTGVWSNAAGDDASTEIFTATPEAKFEGWLVSGERDDLGNPDSTTVPLADGVTLVGEGTAGNSASGHVTVPLVDLSEGATGMDGRYGWWIGDEGVKTRGNLPSAGDPGAAATELTLGARGGGWETVDGMETYPARGAPDEASLSRVFTSPTVSVATPSVRAAAPQLFHSMTAHSRGLLTDTLNGGLRMDLTPYLENGFPGSPVFPGAPAAGENIIPASIAPNIKGPTWDRLQTLPNSRPAGGVLAVSPGNGGNEPLIAPLIFDFRMLMGAQLEPAESDPFGFYVHPVGKIAVVLANPYSLPMQWTQSIELTVFPTSGVGGNTSIWEASGRPRYFAIMGKDDPSVFGGAVFTIAPGRLEPGQALAYTMASRVTRPAVDPPDVEIPLLPFVSSDPSNFSNAITLETTDVNAPPDGHTNPSGFYRSLDVREFSFSSVVGVELRTSGGASLLRRIDSLELDNPAVRSNDRRVRRSDAEAMDDPFPLMLYGYQFSQPGMDYGSLLPTYEQLGIRNSTLRTFLDFNLKAQRYIRPIAGYTTPPYFQLFTNSRDSVPFDPPGGDTGLGFTRNLALPSLRWGHSSVTGSTQTILYSIPEEMVSLAQFQHADLTASDAETTSSAQPANAFGNSYATPFVKRELSSQLRYDYQARSSGAISSPNLYYDMSYLANAALWDGYFLSTIPASGSPQPLNPRLAKVGFGAEESEMHDPRLAARHLLVDGGFNINSTSKDAWKALLSSNRNLAHPSESSAPENSVMFPRSLTQTGTASLPKPSGDEEDSYNGFRRITDQQLDLLAEEITRQVRLRGPFVSLAHFVNRALVPLAGDPDRIGRSGALQSAIDNAGLNLVPGDPDESGFGALAASDNALRLKTLDDGTPYPDMLFPGYVFNPVTTSANLRNAAGDTGPPVWASVSQGGNPANSGSMFADREMLTDPAYRGEQGFRSTGIPGWLTQADVLQVIGPVISARSDTFRIRSYGEALDGSGRVTAKAWCEAIMQRTPEFTDPSDPPETRPADLNPNNAKFGRRFEVVSFRWLHSDEI